MSEPVVIIGAGLAGLAAARTLVQAQIPIRVVEASDAVGGRCRTDRVEGLLLDRGFQLLNPAYPAAQEYFDLPALKLQSFGPGVILASGNRRRVIADPLRAPQHLLSSALGPGSLSEKLAFARWVARVSLGSSDRLRAATDEPLAEALTRLRLTGNLRSSVLDPFLRGVLADAEFSTSRRFVDELVRSFARGRPALPENGMSALSAQLAAKIPTGSIYLNTRVHSVKPGKVSTDGGEFTTPAIIMATDPSAASQLCGLPEVPMRGLTTYYYLAAEAPSKRRYLYLDGDHRGPALNTAVVSAVAPSYAASGSLIQATVLAADDNDEPALRAQLSAIYGVDTTSWSLVARYPISQALPAIAPGHSLSPPVSRENNIFVAGDYRGGASIQGALSSGKRAAQAVLRSVQLREPSRYS